MRTGVLTYTAIVFFVLLFGPLAASLIFPLGGGGGLPGLLAFLGLDFLLGPVYVVFGVAILVMLWGILLNARGTANAREHIRDMLPGAVLVLVIVAVISIVR